MVEDLIVVKNPSMEVIYEDCCFTCKDGGQLLLCEYEGCPKAYHPRCLGKDDSFLETAVSWTCNWHSCNLCNKSLKYQCFLCPRASCGRCNQSIKIAPVRGNKGFCYICSGLTKLIEDNLNVDSDGEKVDFNDQSSVEWLFKEYWVIAKGKENLTSEDVYLTDSLLKKSKENEYAYDHEFEEDEEVDEDVSEYDDSHDLEECKRAGKRKRSKGKLRVEKKKAKDKKKEFIGWGSQSLIEFLTSIGKDTSEQLSQHEVTSIVIQYCEENMLFHPEKKKKILCDARLQSLMGRKTLFKNKIYDRLETHFAENVEQSDSDENKVKSSSEDVETVLLAHKRQRKSSPQRNLLKKAAQESSFASIVTDNIRLVYLRRTLVEKMLKQPETFDSKVIGSFVRVKSDPNDIWQTNSHTLLQVKGIKKTSCVGDITSNVLLQVYNMPNDFPICKLSDDDISKEECKDLHKRMVQGLLKRPSVVELQEKVKSLHEDITKHWIARELVLLRNRIDRANEKGWRREHAEYMDRRKLLETPSEQARMLENVPEVIAEIEDPEPSFEDSLGKGKQENGCDTADGSIKRSHETPGHKFNGCLNGRIHASGFEGTTYAITSSGDKNVAIGDSASRAFESGLETKHDKSGEAVNKQFTQEETAGEKEHQSRACVSERSPPQYQVLAAEIQNGHAAQRNLSQAVPEVNQQFSKTLLPENYPLKFPSFATEGQALKKLSHSDISGGKQNHRAATAVQNQSAAPVEFIELSDDDEQDVRTLSGKRECDDRIWYCVAPHGTRRGPLPLSLLKLWRETGNSDVKWKAWKTGQSQDEAICLDDAIRQAFRD